MKLKFFAASLAPALITFAVTLAQTPGQAPADEAKQQEAQQELARKADAMLGALLSDAQALRLPENRVRALANVAHLLWPRDEKRARELFEEAVGELGKLAAPAEGTLEEQDAGVWQRRQLRGEVLGLLAQHDAEIALKALAATRGDGPPPGAAAQSEDSDQEARLALQLASQLAAKDPRLALAAAEESLDRGEVFGEVSNVIHQLWNTDRAAAVKLAVKLVGGLRADKLSGNPEAFSVASGLLGLISSQDAADGQGGAAQPNQPSVPAATVRALIEQMFAAAGGTPGRSATDGTASIDGPVSFPLLRQLQSSAAVEKYAPATAAALKQAEPQIGQHGDPHSRAWAELNKLTERKSIEALLEAAPQAPTQVRNEYFQRAANLALEQGAPDRAREIITQRLTDPAQRRHALANVDRQVMWKAAQDSRLDEARALALRLPTVQERVQQLAQLSEQAFAKNDRKLALALLDEARAMVGGRAENQQRLWAQLQLAGGYAKLAPERGFQMVEPVVSLFDELTAASATLEGFAQSGGFREGEMLLQGGSVMTGLLQQYAQALAALAHADFERADAIAARFQRAEARVIARLGIAQGIWQNISQGQQAGGIGRGAGYGISRGRGRIIPLSPVRR